MSRLAILTSHPIQYYGPLFRELARRIDLHVFFAHHATPQEQARAGFGAEFEWDVDITSGYSHSYLTNVSRHPSADRFDGCDTPEIGARLSEGRFTALLVLGWRLKTFLQGIWAAKRVGIPVLVRGDSQLETPRSPVKRVAKSLCYPPLLRVFDAALYVGARSRAYYEHYGYPQARLHFSPHCVDTDRFRASATTESAQELRAALGVSPETRLVLFAGKLSAFKRPLDAVAACANLRRRGLPVALIVAGSGELEAAMRGSATDLGAELHLLGFRNQSQMPAVYAAADVLVLPSDGRETWGLVCNEALACGAPIVVSDAVGCAPDLATDGAVGRTHPLGDIVGLADALAATLETRPDSGLIRRKAEAYGLAPAADGVVSAMTATASRRRR